MIIQTRVRMENLEDSESWDLGTFLFVLKLGRLWLLLLLSSFRKFCKVRLTQNGDIWIYLLPKITKYTGQRNFQKVKISIIEISTISTLKKSLNVFLSPLVSNTNHIVGQIPRIQAFDIYIFSHSACPV